MDFLTPAVSMLFYCLVILGTKQTLKKNGLSPVYLSIELHALWAEDVALQTPDVQPCTIMPFKDKEEPQYLSVAPSSRAYSSLWHGIFYP